MKILREIENAAKRVIKRLSPGYGKDLVHRIGRFELRLPYGHMLPVYQREFPQYDRFLPHLAKYLPGDSVIIDVGANCADTVAGMLDTNPSLGFLCIEADHFFYRYLVENVEAIQKLIPCRSIKTVQCLAGSEVSNVTMIGGAGSKRAVVSTDPAGAIRSESLDSIVDAQAVPRSAISLVKVDTDGYDYDVINSADALLSDRAPLLFFECQCDDMAQRSKFERLIHELCNRGYSNWSAFDNYGALLLRSGGQGGILDLIDYVWRQHLGAAHRTFYYIDILVGTDRDAGLIRQALDDY